MAQIKQKLIPIEQRNVATAGTRVQCNGGTSRLATTVVLQALAGNTAGLWVGDSTVAANVGVELAPGEKLFLSIDVDQENEDKSYIDLADLWFDADTNGNKVNVSVIDLVEIDYT